MTKAPGRRGCLWPMWPHDSRPTHDYCGERREGESSYCDFHRRMAIRNLESEPVVKFIPNRKKAA